MSSLLRTPNLSIDVNSNIATKSATGGREQDGLVGVLIRLDASAERRFRPPCGPSGGEPQALKTTAWGITSPGET